MKADTRSKSRQHKVCARLAIFAIFAIFVSCSDGGERAHEDTISRHGTDWSEPTKVRQGQPVIPVIVNSRLGVGSNRLTFGFFGPNGELIHDVVAAELILYAIDDDDHGTFIVRTALRSTSLTEKRNHPHTDGSIHIHHDALITAWTQTVELTKGGWWGADLTVEHGGEQHEQLRLRFFVMQNSQEPAIGDLAPPTRQRTISDGIDITEISTAQPPNPGMHHITIAEALDLGRLMVITFAAPAFCQTRFCGPVLEQVVTPLSEIYEGRVEFLHIEPFDLSRLRNEGSFIPVPAMEEWGLSTEPWIFVVDAQGRIAAKFEGVVSQKEIAEVLEHLTP